MVVKCEVSRNCGHIFLYYYPTNAIQMVQATLPSWAAIKKHSLCMHFSHIIRNYGVCGGKAENGDILNRIFRGVFILLNVFFQVTGFS